jgi:hypothetical protein
MHSNAKDITAAQLGKALSRQFLAETVELVLAHPNAKDIAAEQLEKRLNRRDCVGGRDQLRVAIVRNAILTGDSTIFARAVPEGLRTQEQVVAALVYSALYNNPQGVRLIATCPGMSSHKYNNLQEAIYESINAKDQNVVTRTIVEIHASGLKIGEATINNVLTEKPADLASLLSYLERYRKAQLDKFPFVKAIDEWRVAGRVGGCNMLMKMQQKFAYPYLQEGSISPAVSVTSAVSWHLSTNSNDLSPHSRHR